MENGILKQVGKVARRAVLAGAMTLAPGQGNTEQHSTEKLDGAGWTDGATMLMSDVLTGRGERGAGFLSNETSGRWVPLGKPSGRAGTIYDESDVKRLKTEKPKGGEVTIMCNAHTHSLDALISEGWITEEQAQKMRAGQLRPASLPPTVTDLDQFKIVAEGMYSEIEPEGDFRFSSVVFGPEGGWFYVPASEEYLRKNFPKAFRIQEGMVAMREKLIEILQAIDFGTMENTATSLQKKYGAKYNTAKKDIQSTGAPVDAGNIVFYFLENGLLDSVQDVKDLGLSRDASDLLERFLRIVVRVQGAGMIEAQEKFLSVSMQRAPTEKDYSDVFSAYAQAGWAVWHIDRSGFNDANPCDIPVK